MQKAFTNNKRVGILGGGQLGRMMQIKAYDWGLDLEFMDSDKNAPCNALGKKFVIGDIKDYNHVLQFGKNLDVISIEIENVNVEALKVLESEGKKVFPQPDVIELIQDKYKQKLFYQANKIPTAPFHYIENPADLNNFVAQFPMVQKLCKGGYDGKGVHILKSEADLEQAFQSPSILEEKIPFIKELSVIIARNEKGEMVSFPLVEQEFNPQANLVEFLFSPAEVSQEIETKAVKIAETIIEQLDMIGLLAVELFLTADGELLVNEIAPRPHNSGHHTIEANYESQFGMLLRCLYDMPLASADAKCPAVMVNLLGENGYEGDAAYEGWNEVSALPGVNIHVYGKKTTKSFRKMGHVTVVAQTMEKAKEIALQVKNTLKVKTY